MQGYTLHETGRTVRPLPAVTYAVGLDLGQAQDYTAVAIAERQVDKPPSFHVRHLGRYPLGTPYPAIVAQVVALLGQPPLARDTPLAVDATGVGRPVVDMFRQAGLKGQLLSVTITGGDVATHEGRAYRTPKRDLIGGLQVLLQSGRLKIADALPDAATLVSELLNFQMRINLATAHDSYGAWREGTHDDLVLATALACWAAEQPSRRWVAW
jgi:hypothetical protein